MAKRERHATAASYFIDAQATAMRMHSSLLGTYGSAMSLQS
jgi:hypothetical protein